MQPQKKQRREDRFTYKRPEFIFVEFRLGEGSKKKKVYTLNVIDGSRHGLGILITQKDFDLLRDIKPGVKLHNMKFFASWAMIKVDGIVKKITKIKDGEYKGCYLLGIESKDIIEGHKPNK